MSSNVEDILQATIDGTEYTNAPQSRVEDLLLQLKEKIEKGSGGVDFISGDILKYGSTSISRGGFAGECKYTGWISFSYYVTEATDPESAYITFSIGDSQDLTRIVYRDNLKNITGSSDKKKVTFPIKKGQFIEFYTNNKTTSGTHIDYDIIGKPE